SLKLHSVTQTNPEQPQIKFENLPKDPGQLLVMLLNSDKSLDLLLTVEDSTFLNDAITKAVRYNNRSTVSVGVPMQIDTIRFKPLSEEEKK
ncbi:99_t:CDS:2, partial [Dentiscutata heterogama]